MSIIGVGERRYYNCPVEWLYLLLHPVPQIRVITASINFQCTFLHLLPFSDNPLPLQTLTSIMNSAPTLPTPCATIVLETTHFSARRDTPEILTMGWEISPFESNCYEHIKTPSKKEKVIKIGQSLTMSFVRVSCILQYYSRFRYPPLNLGCHFSLWVRDRNGASGISYILILYLILYTDMLKCK